MPKSCHEISELNAKRNVSGLIIVKSVFVGHQWEIGKGNVLDLIIGLLN